MYRGLGIRKKSNLAEAQFKFEPGIKTTTFLSKRAESLEPEAFEREIELTTSPPATEKNV